MAGDHPCGPRPDRGGYGRAPPPFGVNLIVHRTNRIIEEELALCVKHKVPLVITSLGAVPELIAEIHGYGGLVFHDVINLGMRKRQRMLASTG